MLNGKPIEDLAPHTQRMVEEYAQLSTRLNALRTFIKDNPIYANLDFEERCDLVEQSLGMDTYQTYLERRIKRATAKA